MKNYDATDDLIETVDCAVCDSAVRGGNWHSRINIPHGMVALCSPQCYTTFMDNPETYVRRVHTYCQLHMQREKTGIG